ncbi:ketoacyl-synt-domain-containing protein [Colletotrichum zoysiae]|uniref:Ketoacyl-synt-domain-containing protein n=1 Tax=Colletotrichum zoysiae TaxID=1216348 RepID=A0AAD9M0T0_9PEZI|nr:ketoacyl-synt-domain-containing protein [Colletotrichum zoysiae]
MPEHDAIAIVGLSCRLPGEASSPERFWDMMFNGRSAYSETNKQWNAAGFHGATDDRPNICVARGGHFLDQDHSEFDATFFHISQQEAAAMDPQQRLMLEVSYEAFENAGMKMDQLSASATGCYVGVMGTDWKESFSRDSEAAPKYAYTGSATEFVSSRVSWFFNLTGPSMTVNTACSSSLVAMHLACQSLRTGECETALVGGVNLILNPDFSCHLSRQKFLASDGRCKTFDSAADGYGRGEGCAALVLKRASDAIRDGDSIRAVIRATGLNQDGKTKSITRPSQDAQVSLIRSTYKLAGLDLGEASYFETHGTGTKTGDPIELGAIYETMGILREEGDPLHIGGVKPNIGHGEAVAGLSSVIKCVLMLEKDTILPTTGINELNTKIPFRKWRLEVPRTLLPWPSTKTTRVLSVNGFGAGGTNAHVVLESTDSYLGRPGLRNGYHQESNEDIETHPERPANTLSRPRLYMVTSLDKEGIKRQRQRLRQHVENLPDRVARDDGYLTRLAFTLNQRRSQLSWMSYAVGGSAEQLAESLQDPNCMSFRHDGSRHTRIGFVFTGQAAQWARMGSELLQYDVFANSIKAADLYFTEKLGCSWSALEELLRQSSLSNINDPVYAQPLTVALQVALVELLASWNIMPSSIVGHSSGEIAGSFCAGAISREDAWRIAYAKSQVLKNMTGPPGAMLAASLSEDEAQIYIANAASKGRVVAACINSPSSVTLSGDTAAIEDIQEQLKAQGLFQRRLAVSSAYHSHHMKPIAGEFRSGIEGIRYVANGTTSTIPMYSSVTGEVVDPCLLGSPDYWVSNVVSPVRFSEAMSELAKAGVDIVLEIGPHCGLKSPITQILKACGLNDVHYQSILYRGKNAVDTALQCAGALAAQAVPVNIEAVNRDERLATALRRPVTDLPSYAWNHTRSYWAEPPLNRDHRLRCQPRRDLIGAPFPCLSASERIWRGFLRVSDEPWIDHHRVQSAIRYPAAGFLSMAIEGARQLSDPKLTVKKFRIRDFELKNAALIPDDGELESTLTVRRKTGGALLPATGWLEFSVSSRGVNQDFRQNCHGLIKIEYDSPGPAAVRKVTDAQHQDMCKREFGRIEQQCTQVQDQDYLYNHLDEKGLRFGPNFRTLSEIRRGNDVSLCTITIPTSGSNFTPAVPERPHIVHPATLDGLMQCFFAATIGKNGSLKAGMVPRRVDEVTVSAKLPYQAGTRFRACAVAHKHGMQEMRSNAMGFDENIDEPLMTIQGVNWTPLQGPATEQRRKGLCFEMSWQPLSSEVAHGTAHGDTHPESHATVLKGASDSGSQDICLIEPDGLEPTAELFITKLCDHVTKSCGGRMQRVKFGQVLSDLKKKRCVFLELGKPFLETPGTAEFVTLKQYILDSLNIHWITFCDGPGAGLVTGFARTLRNEIPNLTFRTLHCTRGMVSETTATGMSIISRFVSEKHHNDGSTDSEFRLRDGRLEVCRVRECVELNDEIYDMTSSKVAPVALKDVTSDIVLKPQTIGSLDGLRFEAVGQLAGVDLADDEVEIETKATGLNLRDVLTVMGEIPDDNIGHEAAGVVVRKGAAVTRFEPGDRVCCLAPGAHRTRLRVREKLCQDIGDMTYQDAASLPLIFCTAYHALVDLARLKPGQSVLIHSAAGGVGQAALQVAKHLGLDVFATVSSAEKRKLLTTHYEVPDDHIFNSRDLSFREGIMAVTDGRGVDCVLNSLAGEALGESWHCLAPFGTFVEVGMKDILNNSALDMRPFGSSATFCFFSLELMERVAPDMLADIFSSVFSLVRHGELKPVAPVMCYHIAQVENAFRLMQAGKHRGKIVLDFESHGNETIQVAKSIRHIAKLSSDATYVLVGGLGGLGRSLSDLLVSQGARNLCFLSLSGAASRQAQSLVQRLESLGVRIKVTICDVSNEAEVGKALKDCTRDMPPIKGVIQAAMVLRDAVFERMTHAQWEQSLGPKVRGSWNLHRHMPEGVDFFVMLSSYCGIWGNRGQANYTAGCAFQDELAHFRRRQGLKAMSIDLGAMRDVGILADKGAVGDMANWIEPFGILEEEFHAIMVLSIARQAGEDWAAKEPQLVTGLATGEAASLAGVFPWYLNEPKFTLIAQYDGQQRDDALTPVDSPVARLAQAESLAEAVDIVVSRIVATLSKSLQMPTEDIDVTRPLYFYGVDSLVAIEMRNWVIKELSSDVSLDDILAHVPITQLAETVTKASKAFNGRVGDKA